MKFLPVEDLKNLNTIVNTIGELNINYNLLEEQNYNDAHLGVENFTAFRLIMFIRSISSALYVHPH